MRDFMGHPPIERTSDRHSMEQVDTTRAAQECHFTMQLGGPGAVDSGQACQASGSGTLSEPCDMKRRELTTTRLGVAQNGTRMPASFNIVVSEAQVARAAVVVNVMLTLASPGFQAITAESAPHQPRTNPTAGHWQCDPWRLLMVPSMRTCSFRGPLQ